MLMDEKEVKRFQYILKDNGLKKRDEYIEKKGPNAVQTVFKNINKKEAGMIIGNSMNQLIDETDKAYMKSDLYDACFDEFSILGTWIDEYVTLGCIDCGNLRQASVSDALDDVYGKSFFKKLYSGDFKRSANSKIFYKTHEQLENFVFDNSELKKVEVLVFGD